MGLGEAIAPSVVLLGILGLVAPALRKESRAVRESAFWIINGLRTWYFYWRITETLPESEQTSAFLFGVAFLVCELLVTFAAVRFAMGLFEPKDRRAEADEHQGWHLRLERPPLIDILVPTYNEAWSIVEKTLIGALAQDYPRFRVWLLDDGRRPEFERNARAIGVGYLARKDNEHAKAGNLNHALAHIASLREQPDFIAVLDADFVARPAFLKRTLALMHDPSVGLVQTPQYHYNSDPFQSAFRSWRAWPDTQRFVFNVVLPGLDARGGAYCCGTSFLARASALQAIGGFPTEAVTEDVLTTLKLAFRGQRTVYLREVLTTGLAPEGVREYLTQRARWCLGSVQVGLWLFAIKGGRSLRQRLLGLEAFLRWGYTSAIRLFMFAVPLIYWFSGVGPLRATSLECVFYFFPIMILARAYSNWIGHGTNLPFIADGTSLLASYSVVPAFFHALMYNKNRRFVVTDKGHQHAGFVVHWGPLRWFLAYTIASAAGVVYAFETGALALDMHSYKGLGLIWTMANLTAVFVAAVPCIEPPRRRSEERYPTTEPVLVQVGSQTREAKLRDLSVSGCCIVHEEQPFLQAGAPLRVRIKDVGWVEASLTRGGADVAGVRFELDDAQRHALIRKIFCSDAYVLPAESGDGLVAAGAVLRKAVGF